jgi:hypothetical protein
MASTTKECVASAASGERRDHAVADGNGNETVAVGCRERVEEPPVIPPQINREDNRIRRGKREGLQHIDMVTTDQFDVGAEMQQVVNELRRHASRCRARQHPNRPPLIGEQPNDRVDPLGIEPGECPGDVVLLGSGVTTNKIVGSTEPADALSSREELCGEFALYVALQADEAFVPELGGEPHDRRCSRFGRCGHIGNGAESDDLRRGQQDVGNATLRRRQRGTTRLEALCDRHNTNGSHSAAPERTTTGLMVERERFVPIQY